MKLRTITEAAKTLGIPEYRLRRGIAAGKYPSMKWGSRRLVDVEALGPIIAEERRREADEGNVGLKECAKAIGVSADVLYRMAVEGLVPFTRAGRAYRFRIKDVEAAIRKNMT